MPRPDKGCCKQRCICLMEMVGSWRIALSELRYRTMKAIRVCEVICITCVRIHKVNRKEEEWMQVEGLENVARRGGGRGNCDHVGKNN